MPFLGFYSNYSLPFLVLSILEGDGGLFCIPFFLDECTEILLHHCQPFRHLTKERSSSLFCLIVLLLYSDMYMNTFLIGNMYCH